MKKKMIIHFPSGLLVLYWFFVIWAVSAPTDWNPTGDEILVAIFSVAVAVTVFGYLTTAREHLNTHNTPLFKTSKILAIASFLWIMTSIALLYAQIEQLVCVSSWPGPLDTFIIFCNEMQVCCTGPVLVITTVVCFYSAWHLRSIWKDSSQK